MPGFNPVAILAAVAIAAAIWWTGFTMGGADAKAGFGERFEKRLAIEREVSIRREVNLWTQIGDERRARLEMIGTFQRIDALSAEARSRMMAAMTIEKLTAQEAMDRAAANIRELKDAASEMARNWKSGVIPPDITCGVFDGAGCPGPAYPATGPDRDNDLEVREPAPLPPDAS